MFKQICIIGQKFRVQFLRLITVLLRLAGFSLWLQDNYSKTIQVVYPKKKKILFHSSIIKLLFMNHRFVSPALLMCVFLFDFDTWFPTLPEGFNFQFLKTGLVAIFLLRRNVKKHIWINNVNRKLNITLKLL